MEPNTKSQTYHYKICLQFSFALPSTWFWQSLNFTNNIMLHYQAVRLVCVRSKGKLLAHPSIPAKYAEAEPYGTHMLPQEKDHAG